MYYFKYLQLLIFICIETETVCESETNMGIRIIVIEDKPVSEIDCLDLCKILGYLIILSFLGGAAFFGTLSLLFPYIAIREIQGKPMVCGGEENCPAQAFFLYASLTFFIGSYFLAKIIYYLHLKGHFEFEDVFCSCCGGLKNYCLLFLILLCYPFMLLFAIPYAVFIYPENY